MSIKMTTDLEALAEAIGTYLGVADGLESRQYMDSMLEIAHNETVPDFAKAAALSAKKFNFTHMYEYGVAGITRGDRQFINPVLPSARLWTDHMVGSGRTKRITFLFRQATRRVPAHTTEETGVAQEELDKLKVNQGKRYVFQNKAEVFEQGIPVSIHGKQKHGRLFIPLKTEGHSVRGVTAKDEARGFTWRRSVRLNPGADTDSIGQFSEFFFVWWSTEGAERMASSMQRTVDTDLASVESKVSRYRSPLESPKTNSINGTVKRARSKTRKQWTIRAEREAGYSEVIL
jgi:hypothetical protein